MALSSDSLVFPSSDSLWHNACTSHPAWFEPSHKARALQAFATRHSHPRGLTSMKFFTATAVCVLVFCLLLALSGTSDLPQQSPPSPSPAHLSASSSDPAAGPAVARPTAHRRLPEWTEEHRPLPSGLVAVREISRNRQIRLIGLLFIAGWIFLSFKLLSTD